MRSNIYKKTLVHLIISMLLSLVFMLPFYIFYNNTKSTLLNEIKLNATSLAGSISVLIQQDIEQYRSLYNVDHYVEDMYDEHYYQKMLKIFRDIKQKTQVSYIFTEKVFDDYIVYILDAEVPGSKYFSPIGTRDSLGALEYLAYKTKTPMATDIIHEAYWGDYITGFAPIISEDTSETLGLVGVDFSADYIISHLRQLRIFIYTVYLFFTILLFLLASTIVEKVSERLRYDYLTGLFNRNSIDKRLGYLIKTNRWGALSVAMIDVDRFKYINDTFGHHYGDIVLKRVAHLIATNIKRTDLASRYGGDEFVIVFENTDIKGAANVCNRLIMKTQSDDIKNNTNEQISYTLSIGIAELKNNNTSAKELLRLADIALLKAKEKGKNQCVVYEENMSH